jgi:hypothetical protein
LLNNLGQSPSLSAPHLFKSICRKAKIGSIALADMLSHEFTFGIKDAEKQQVGHGAGVRAFNVVAVIGRREAKVACTGNPYLRWHLTGEPRHAPPFAPWFFRLQWT